MNSDQFLEFENYCKKLDKHEIAFGQNENLPEEEEDQKLL